MGFMSAVEDGTNSLGQFIDGQGAIGFKNAPLGVKPLGFDRIKPGTLGGQWTDQQANALSSAFGLLVMEAHPRSHRLATMPGGVIPDQGQDTLAERLGFVTQ